jgi:hypothetical protein
MIDFLAASYGIQQLFARFTDAAWRQDTIAFAETFGVNGEWKIAGMRFQRREEIVEACARLLGRYERIHLISPMPILHIGDGGVSGRHQMTEYSRTLGGDGVLTIGVYHDEYIEQDRHWLFAKRHFSLKYRGPFDMSGSFVDTPDYGTFPGRPHPDELTYIREG